MFENILGCTELHRALKIGYIFFSCRFKLFVRHSSRITLEWDEITNVVVLKVNLKQAAADWLRSGGRWLVKEWSPLIGQAWKQRTAEKENSWRWLTPTAMSWRILSGSRLIWGSFEKGCLIDSYQKKSSTHCKIK